MDLIYPLGPLNNLFNGSFSSLNINVTFIFFSSINHYNSSINTNSSNVSATYNNPICVLSPFVAIPSIN